MNDEQVKYMVNRFLGWRLPKNFNPDGGISFKQMGNEHRPEWSYKNNPTGTNLLDFTQAEEMVRYMVEGMPKSMMKDIFPDTESLQFKQDKAASGIVGSKDRINNGEVQKAIRRALNIFDKWVECTGAITDQTGVYYEIQGCIEDAVHCGVQAAMGLRIPLDSEKE